MLRVFQLTRREYFADFFITPPITFALLVMSLWQSGGERWPFAFAVGGASWTFYEYVVHRFVSHRLGIFRKAHFLHHSDPKEHIALHPIATVTLYGFTWLAFGANSSAAAVGFSIGYVAYSTLHTLFHYAPAASRRWAPRLYKHHMGHHKYGVVNFGVTTRFWDRVFETDRC